MKLMIDIPNEWFDQMVREEFTNYPSKVDELCAIIQHSVAIPSAEPCEDAISRDAVLEKAVYTETEEGWCGYTVDVDYIKSLPSVKPQEKTGHWIEHPEIKTSTPEYLMFYECSECGDKQCFCKSDIQKKHFCNNCGARMVEPQESEDKE